MSKLVLSILLILAACAKHEEQIDNWETPSLMFKKADQDSSKKGLVTKSFRESLSPNDEFEFIFKGDNSSKRKSIANIRVLATCAADPELSQGVFEENYDLGMRPIFTAHDLLPPQLQLENSKSVFCKWTIVAINLHGSTRSYLLPILRLDDDNTNAKILVKDTQGNQVTPGTYITGQNSRGLKFTLPESGSFSSNLKCDLINIGLPTSNTSVSDLIAEDSDNEALRLKHPMQRCLIEVKSSTGKIYRSAGFKFYLFPVELSQTHIQFDPNNNFESVSGSTFIGSVRIKNNSDEERTFGFISPNLNYDIFFFDDRGHGGTTDDLPNSGHYWYQSKSNGQPRIQHSTARDFINIAGMKLLVLRPHEDISGVELFLHYSVGCNGGGEYSIGGLRVPYGSELFGEQAPYFDKRGALVNLRLPGSSANFTSPAPYFIRFFHNKLVGNPRTYNRQWRPADRGC